MTTPGPDPFAAVEMPPLSGITRIAAERLRQIEREGWTPEHDDAHDAGELARAASCYVHAAIRQIGYVGHVTPPSGWPWELSAWKPGEDPVRSLEKAGALIAAELDRLLRARERGRG